MLFHVGDWYEGDVIGARGVGITAILIDRESQAPPKPTVCA